MAAQSQKGINITLVILLVASLGFNVYLWINKNTIIKNYITKVELMAVERQEVDKELNDTYTELNQYKGINSKLDSLLQEANAKVDEQKARIESLIRSGSNTAAINKSLREELESIKKLRNEYLLRIDSLMAENVTLKKEKTDLTITVDSLSKNLKATVNTASVLKAEYIKVKSFKRKGSAKYAETTTAKRTNKIEACFSIMDNTIAKGGERTIYLRIIEPGGKVLGDRLNGSSTFKKSGSDEEILYTSTQTINYNNQKQDLCLKHEEKERVFTAGTYLIEVYVDGNLAGNSTLNLK